MPKTVQEAQEDMQFYFPYLRGSKNQQMSYDFTSSDPRIQQYITSFRKLYPIEMRNEAAEKFSNVCSPRIQATAKLKRRQADLVKIKQKIADTQKRVDDLSAQAKAIQATDRAKATALKQQANSIYQKELQFLFSEYKKLTNEINAINRELANIDRKSYDILARFTRFYEGHQKDIGEDFQTVFGEVKAAFKPESDEIEALLQLCPKLAGGDAAAIQQLQSFDPHFDSTASGKKILLAAVTSAYPEVATAPTTTIQPTPTSTITPMVVTPSGTIAAPSTGGAGETGITEAPISEEESTTTKAPTKTPAADYTWLLIIGAVAIGLLVYHFSQKSESLKTLTSEV